MVQSFFESCGNDWVLLVPLCKARPQLLLAIVLYTEDNNVLVKCGCSILQAVMCWKGRILHNS